ncbi:SIR2 family NAD-dependent protein deacylase [Eisenibacter elegans]|uniref:SIR2 family NAD-dependent protein deacylase n=1 Tax=Eisenibacter elegans TaxID=997 RepID=UPI00041DFA48|nr:Sir2 family NAD-dependent protein deacetylase [Eisenibacter elegans]
MHNHQTTQVLVQEAREYLAQAEVLLINTGAGMSADSGIPTYRGNNGLWGQLEGERQGDIRHLMTPAYILEHPLYMWRRFAKGYRRSLSIDPHEGFAWLKAYVEQRDLPHFCITSNVDGLFAKAGFDPIHIYEIHGSGAFWQCSRPCQPTYWKANFRFDPEAPRLELSDLPHCPNCGALARPNVLLFQDDTFVRERVEAQKQVWERFLDLHAHKRWVALEIGAGIHIKAIRAFSQRLMRQQEALVIRINPDYPEIEAPHIGLPLTALDAIKQLMIYDLGLTI